MLYVQPLIGMPFGEAGTPDGSQTAVECDGVDCPIVIDEPIVGGELKANLAVLDLLRGQTHSLPGGIAYAEFVRTFVPSLTVRICRYRLGMTSISLRVWPNLDLLALFCCIYYMYMSSTKPRG